MKYLIFIILMLTVFLWWSSIYLFGIYGAMGCVILGVLSAIYVKFKGLP